MKKRFSVREVLFIFDFNFWWSNIYSRKMLMINGNGLKKVLRNILNYYTFNNCRKNTLFTRAGYARFGLGSPRDLGETGNLFI